MSIACLRVGSILKLQLLRPAELVNANGFHLSLLILNS
jgi:hypothetical protein